MGANRADRVDVRNAEERSAGRAIGKIPEPNQREAIPGTDELNDIDAWPRDVSNGAIRK